MEEYKSFVYFYEGEAAKQNGNQQQTSLSIESQPVNAKLHSDAKLQNVGNAHSDSKNNTHERDEELPDRSVHNESDAERPNMETRTKSRLSKYVRMHHPTYQIIGDKEAIPMTRNTLRNDTCFLSMKEPKIIKDVDQSKAIEEEIEKIEKNKAWTLLPRLEEKNIIGKKWVYRNKLDENGEVARNKLRLVCNGYA